MKNFNLRTLLASYPVAESAISENSIRLVRHQMKDWSGFNSMLRFNKDVLKVFTAEQGKDIFSNHRLILVFVSRPGGRALLSGAFVNHGLITRDAFEQIQGYAEYTQYRKSIDLNEHSRADFFYDLQVCHELEELFDRLVIDWGGATLSWYQNKIDKEICQILAPGFVKTFPGWDEVNITHQELSAIIQNPEGNPDWEQFLKAHDGVYLILDNATGRQYVGSATGEQAGLWGRWTGYASNGHNSNKLLHELLIERGNMHKRNFTFSLHHVFARGAATKKEVLFYESLLKKKLGSRAFGLNAN
jgi:hypothetical protein